MKFYSTSIVTVLNFLDLYDVRTKVREEHRRGWARKNTRQVKDSDSPQGGFYSFSITRRGR